MLFLSIAISFFSLSLMPDVVPIHWNAAGEADGFASNEIAASIFPIVTIFILALFYTIPKIDPKKDNIKKFRKNFDWLMFSITAFLFYLNLLTVGFALGFSFNMTQAIAPAMGLLFYVIGMMIKNIKQNYTIGIRTPWTLDNKENWKRTHETGGKLFEISGLIAFLGFFFPLYAIWLILIPIITTAAIVFIYSYWIYQKDTNYKK